MKSHLTQNLIGMQIQAQLVIHASGVEQRTCNVISLALQSTNQNYRGVDRVLRSLGENYARRGHHTNRMQANQQRAFTNSQGVSHAG